MRYLRYQRNFFKAALAANALFMAVVFVRAICENFDNAMFENLIRVSDVSNETFRNFVPFEDEGDGLLVFSDAAYRPWNESEDGSRVLSLVKKISRYPGDAAKVADQSNPRQITKLKN